MFCIVQMVFMDMESHPPKGSPNDLFLPHFATLAGWLLVAGVIMSLADLGTWTCCDMWHACPAAGTCICFHPSCPQQQRSWSNAKVF